MNEWEWRLLEDKAPAGSLSIAGVEVKPGHRVRLHPGKRGDDRVNRAGLRRQISCVRRNR
jgi:hypothetical protein